MYSPGENRLPSVIPRLVVALVLFAAGLGVLGYGLSSGANRFADPLTAPYQSGDFTQHLDTGRYLVYAPDAAAASETPTDLTVTAPDDSNVAITGFTGTESQTRGGNDYSAYAQFHTTIAGTYRFTLAPNGPTRVIVARTLLDSVKALVGPAIEVGAGGIAAIIGLVVLLRTFTRRRWQRRIAPPQWNQPWDPAAQGMGPFPGQPWMPQPQAPGQTWMPQPQAPGQTWTPQRQDSPPWDVPPAQSPPVAPVQHAEE
jgi:hypothetical protein